MDAALSEKCADPSLTPAIVDQFVAAAGSEDPLAITIRSGGRLVLVPKPKTPDEALNIVKEYVGKASVRVGITQLPAGLGIKDAGQLDAGVVDPCENIKRGTALFAKIGRIVTKWYGSPDSEDVLPQMFEDAVMAWRTGEFEGENVFRADDPGGATFLKDSRLKAVAPTDATEGHDRNEAAGLVPEQQADQTDGGAEMRIDLSRIGVR